MAGPSSSAVLEVSLPVTEVGPHGRDHRFKLLAGVARHLLAAAADGLEDHDAVSEDLSLRNFAAEGGDSGGISVVHGWSLFEWLRGLVIRARGGVEAGGAGELDARPARCWRVSESRAARSSGRS